MTQPDLFNQPVPIPSRAPAAMRPRLSRQCEELLAMLRRGDLSNDQMARVARKYTSRISELRQAGYDVRPVSHNHATGLVVYRLQEGK